MLLPPKQERSRRTLERIVRAALAILDEQGSDALTVQAIVARAGSSVGSFYARFRGKGDLLEYLGDRVWREAAERWDEALAAQDWSGLDLGAMVEGFVRLLADAGRSRASYLRALDRTPGLPDDAYRSFRSHVIRGIEGVLLSKEAEIGHPDPAVAVRLGFRAALAIVDDAPEPGAAEVTSAAEGSSTAEALSDPGLDRRVEEAVSMLMGYLGASTPPRPVPPEQVDFFDIWG